MNSADRKKNRLTPTETEVQPWTAEEFERLVFECKPKVAVFDCDGTLWSGDAGYGFMAWSLEQGLVSRSTNDWIDSRYRAYRAGRRERSGDVRRDGADVRRVARQRIGGSRSALRGGVCARARLCRDGRIGQEDSAGRDRDMGSEFDESLGDRRGAARLWHPEGSHSGSGSARKDGIITSEIVDVPTDEAKAAALKRVGLPAPDAVFGNSIHDLAMLEMARCAFPVNPFTGAKEAAAKKGLGLLQAAGCRGHRSGGGRGIDPAASCSPPVSRHDCRGPILQRANLDNPWTFALLLSFTLNR